MGIVRRTLARRGAAHAQDCQERLRYRLSPRTTNTYLEAMRATRPALPPPRRASTARPAISSSIRCGRSTRALITHGHSDHARAGHGAVLATRQTLDIMALRYGDGFRRRHAGGACSARRSTLNGVDGHASIRPAMCSARRRSRSSTTAPASSPRATTSAGRTRPALPFEPVRCDVFITEATFGLPVFRHPPDARRDRPAAQSVSAVSGARASRRRLCARQGAARHPAAARRRLRRADLHPRRAGAALRLLREPGHRSRRRCSPATVESGAKADFAGAIVVGPPSAFADRWARRFPDPVACFASGWMRIRQRAKQRGVELPLIISDHSDWDELTETIARDRRRARSGSPMAARRRWCAGASCRASPRGRCIWSATRTRATDEEPCCGAASRARPRPSCGGGGPTSPGSKGHEPLRRTPRPPRPDAVAQRQADAARRLFPRVETPTAASARRHHRRPVDRRVKPAMLRALVAERMDQVLFGYSYDYVGDLAETVSLVWPEPTPHSSANHEPTLGEVVEQAAVGEPLGRADGARAPARQRRHPGALRAHQAGHRRPAGRRLGAARQAGAGRFRQGRRHRDRGALARADAALRRAVRLAGRQGAEAGAGAPGRCSGRSCWRNPVEDGDLDKLDPADYAAEWKWDGIRVQAVSRRRRPPALFAHRRRHLRRLSRSRRGAWISTARSTASCWSARRRECDRHLLRPAAAAEPQDRVAEDARAIPGLHPRLRPPAGRRARICARLPFAERRDAAGGLRRARSTRRASTSRRSSPSPSWEELDAAAHATRRIRSSRA